MSSMGFRDLEMYLLTGGGRLIAAEVDGNIEEGLGRIVWLDDAVGDSI